MRDLRLHLEGGDAQAAAAEIAVLVEPSFGRRPERVRAGQSGGEGEKAEPG